METIERLVNVRRKATPRYGKKALRAKISTWLIINLVANFMISRGRKWQLSQGWTDQKGFKGYKGQRITPDRRTSMSKGTKSRAFLLDQAHPFGLNLEDTGKRVAGMKRLGIELGIGVFLQSFIKHEIMGWATWAVDFKRKLWPNNGE